MTGGGVQFNLYTEDKQVLKSPGFQVNDTFKCIQTKKYAIVKDINFHGHSILYMIKYLHSNTMVEREEHELNDLFPPEADEEHSYPLWMRDGAKINILLPAHSTKAKEGYLKWK